MTIKREWGIGGYIIIGAGILATLSMTLSWVNLSSLSCNGIQQRTYFYLVFFIYPIIITIKNYKINELIGYVSSCLAILCGIKYITTKNTFFFGNLSSIGAYVFTLSSIILMVGVYKYKNKT
ncbi:hypothetical protein [Pseudobacteroides cellulosolvens]|uniref:Uncharacterized protein n=1 Tax=Pseudobacteroides cellulosolvens ATCC 35603 = DSM 2933 TaxID=398512 RepID=A0A0L6JVR3_9FIRM|nr:hypothetical protein [Pseudobacteroides cellulosolvens]KNY29961.1 hypothetical protein Bccel_5238 [Pseudobacteroides cellulosolvens ATCC 35603 = DSM 2933]